MYKKLNSAIAIASLFTSSAFAQSLLLPEPPRAKVKTPVLKALPGEYYALIRDDQSEATKPEDIIYCHTSVKDSFTGEPSGPKCFTGLVPGSAQMKGTSLSKDNPYEFVGEGLWRHKGSGHELQFYVPKP